MANNNIPEYTVTELSNALKNVVESSFDKVIVKGEVSRIFVAQSGHAYITIKDEISVLETICFKNVFEKIELTPEQGLEVHCEGRMSTFSKKSSYQLIINDIRPAGLGALMAMLEARKLKLMKGGYFDDKNKKKLPYLPDVIGVITSLKGAVIKDILHRFKDRFPREVLIWPTLVQGEGASLEIIKAIKGFNGISTGNKIKKPDIIIIARGGGSIEDLWCFNDEDLIIAVSKSEIPIISAIGHETDTTLIDLASDFRAPTPTAAAEIAVPVKLELIEKLSSFTSRLISSLSRTLKQARIEFNSASRGFKSPESNIENYSQRIDFASSKLRTYFKQKINLWHDKVSTNRISNKNILYNFSYKNKEFSLAEKSLLKLLGSNLTELDKRNKLISSNLKKDLIISPLKFYFEKIHYSKKILETLSYRNTLNRGFALIRSTNDKKPIDSVGRAIKEDIIEIEFYDGSVDAKLLKIRKKQIESSVKKNIHKKDIQEKLL